MKRLTLCIRFEKMIMEQKTTKKRKIKGNYTENRVCCRLVEGKFCTLSTKRLLVFTIYQHSGAGL